MAPIRVTPRYLPPSLMVIYTIAALHDMRAHPPLSPPLFLSSRTKTPQEREEKEEKKKEADAESAKIYEQFVQSFGVSGADEGKTFLRGGVAGGSTPRGSRLSAPGSGPGGGAGGALGAYGPGSGGVGAASAVAMPLALAG